MSLSHPLDERGPEEVEAFCQQCSEETCLPCPHTQTLIALEQASRQKASNSQDLPNASSSQTEVSPDQIDILQPLSDLPPLKRGPGAPKGNQNALKHGLYIEGVSIRNTNPIERARLMDFNDIITHFKNYMDATYEQGLKAKTLAEFNETMRSLSMGLLALSRGVVIHNNFSSSYLPEKLKNRKNLSEDEVLAYYTKKLITFSHSAPSASGDQLNPETE